MSFFNIFKLGSQKVNIGKKRPFLKRIGRDVYVDWTLSVITAFAVAIILVFLGLREKSLFMENLGAENKVITTKDSSNIDTKVLDAVLNRYEERVLRGEDLMRGYVGPQDPSL
jgi:hypothetical protein